MIFLALLGLVCIWQIVDGGSPLVSWVLLILAHVGIMAILFVRHKASPKASAVPALSADGPTSLVRSVEYLNKHADMTGQPIPRLPAGLSEVAGSRSSTMAAKVRAYASVEDAQSYGWVFSNKVGVFNDQPIFQTAKLDDQEWEYDGLASEVLTASVPADRRIFGQLRYRQSQVDDAATSPSPAIQASTEKPSIGGNSGLDADVEGVRAS